MSRASEKPRPSAKASAAVKRLARRRDLLWCAPGKPSLVDEGVRLIERNPRKVLEEMLREAGALVLLLPTVPGKHAPGQASLQANGAGGHGGQPVDLLAQVVGRAPHRKAVADERGDLVGDGRHDHLGRALHRRRERARNRALRHCGEGAPTDRG